MQLQGYNLGLIRIPSSRSGFSLTEVAMALAVFAFAFLALLALIPNSLDTFRSAINATVTSQIAQRLIADAQEADFDFLVNKNRNGAEASTPEFSRLATRYFDDQGNEVTAPAKAIYWAVMRVSQPGPRDSANGTTDWFTSLPSTGVRFNPRDMTFVTLEIVANPGGIPLPYDSRTLLLDRELAQQKRLPYRTYATVVARNGRELSR